MNDIPGQGAASFDNRRNAQRRRVMRAAQLVFNHGRSTIDCTLRDISATGARARVSAPVDLPPELQLKLVDGTVYDCRLRWYRGSEVGLEMRGESVLKAAGSQRLNAWGVYREAEKLMPDAVLRRLREHHFFQDDDLAVLAEAWREAHEGMLRRLQRHASADGGDAG